MCILSICREITNWLFQAAAFILLIKKYIVIKLFFSPLPLCWNPLSPPWSGSNGSKPEIQTDGPGECQHRLGQRWAQVRDKPHTAYLAHLAPLGKFLKAPITAARCCRTAASERKRVFLSALTISTERLISLSNVKALFFVLNPDSTESRTDNRLLCVVGPRWTCTYFKSTTTATLKELAVYLVWRL